MSERASAQGWRRVTGRGGGPHPLSQIQIARIYVHSSPTGIYPTLLFTYPFICFAPISTDREFLCLHAPGVCPRKATTCERFTATITQFSSERSLFIGLRSNNVTLPTSVNIFVCHRWLSVINYAHLLRIQVR